MKIRNSIIASLLVLMAFSTALAEYQATFKITPEDIVDRHHNFTTMIEQERYLIHYDSACGIIDAEDDLTIVKSGELDGVRDQLRVGQSVICEIDQIDKVNAKATVTAVGRSDTYTTIRDEQMRDYRIYYSENCSALSGQDGNTIHLYLYGSELSEGDIIYMPESTVRCALTYVQKISDDEPTEEVESDRDIKHPSTPTNVRAIPTKNAVYLYWEPSTDDSGISHYIVNASLYHYEDAHVQEPGELVTLDNMIVTDTNEAGLRLTDLDADELYFFRVVAVDDTGNMSSYWSQEATAQTHSAFAEIDLRGTPLRIYDPLETEESFLFRWNTIPSDGSYNISLYADNERLYSNTSYPHTHVYIRKTTARKNKTLTLKVKATDIHGTIYQDEREFSF